MEPGQELSPEEREAQEWAHSCDPMQLVEITKNALYSGSDLRSDPRVKAATSEIVSRFEQGSRSLNPTFAGSP